MQRRREFWVRGKDAEEVSHEELLRWCRSHPRKWVKVIELGPKNVMLYAMEYRVGEGYYFDSPLVNRNLLNKVMSVA